MARFLAALFFAGAKLGTASLAFHQEPGSQPLGVLAVAAVAYVV
ncbi:MAG: hypothetical protein QOH46_4261, partial [Solirubrobacteraceae bacterium]|nr:hypothetical protein [Solirubrobacteraceae bacterium]